MTHSGTMNQSCPESKERLIAAHFWASSPKGPRQWRQRMEDPGHG
jgi:hypothetical protein